ncbi:c-type cytochrome [Telmatobacter sp. DSM 110680]|uniref:C-type cytochrome n=1 Tax=Telmatobacter sp. DSM 110680 TaxID=3036704 RepID=A0AAU7DQV9_9BACT
MKHLRILMFIFVACLASTSWSQSKEKEIKLAPVPYSDPTSGAQMYKDYCASCHGLQGKGDGPAAQFVKAAPTDLSRLAERNDGKYPRMKVEGILKFGLKGHAHGSIDMPIWGDLFQSRFGQAPDLRANNLVKFVASLQQGGAKSAVLNR